jgi:diacylglycerol kinase (ATP)
MGYSLNGLAASFRKEEAIKLELLAMALLVAVLCLVPWPIWKKLALLGSYILIPLTELANSAIEDICDLVSPGFNQKVKEAKDKGSAAVLLAIAINFLVLAALMAAG